MRRTVSIGGREVGHGHRTYIIAEVGINHNGDLDLARRLVDAAVSAGCDAVKFQKRTPECVSRRSSVNVSERRPGVR